jgi:predicted metal-dependent enzyme (double-stranded beta helix superfamily)
VQDDEFLLDTPAVRGFVESVRAAISAAPGAAEACDAIRPDLEALLADPRWLPGEYQAPAAPRAKADDVAPGAGGMGGGIGQWLLFRAGDASLSLFSLVVPAGVATPVHDHLAWGLVGLYRGTQDEEVYGWSDGRFGVTERRALVPGDLYALIPPVDDVHRVRTTSPTPSVSIHLLTNDTGCVWRHAYDQETGAAQAFRSGYANVDCREDG